MRKKTWKIYRLVDPATGEPRYIGKTHRTLNRRLVAHIYEAETIRRGDTHKNRWIRKLLRSGLCPTIELLHSGEGPGWEEVEIATIAEYRKNYGSRLLNQAPGGGGWTDDMPEEIRDKIRQKALGRKLSEATRLKMSRAKKGKPLGPQTEEHRKNSANARKGLRHSKEWCENHSKLLTGKFRGPVPRDEMLALRRARYQKKADTLGIPVEQLPEYYTTPEMIDVALAQTNQNKAKAARLLGVTIGIVYYHCHPRNKVQ